MENEETTVDFQDETQEEETFEVDESEELTDDDSTDNDENSTQNQDEELKKAQAEIAKLNRLLKKQSKDEKPSEQSPSDESKYVTKEDLEKIRLEAKGYDEDQVNFLMRFGGSEALQDEAVQTVVKTMAEKKAQVNAQATGKSQGKTARRYSQDDLRAMPIDKLEKLMMEGKIK